LLYQLFVENIFFRVDRHVASIWL